MSAYQIEILRSLNQDQRFAFQTEFDSRKKDATVAILLALFLGAFGAHHFYLGKTGLGVLYLLFFWTSIPWIVALVECFFLGNRVREYNDRLTLEIASKVKLFDAPASITRANSAFCTSCGAPTQFDAKFCASCGAANAAIAAT